VVHRSGGGFPNCSGNRNRRQLVLSSLGVESCGNRQQIVPGYILDSYSILVPVNPKDLVELKRRKMSRKSRKHALRCATPSQIVFVRLTPQKFSLWWPRGAIRHYRDFNSSTNLYMWVVRGRQVTVQNNFVLDWKYFYIHHRPPPCPQLWVLLRNSNSWLATRGWCSRMNTTKSRFRRLMTFKFPSHHHPVKCFRR